MTRRSPSERAGWRAVTWRPSSLPAMTLALATALVVAPPAARAGPDDPPPAAKSVAPTAAQQLELHDAGSPSIRRLASSWMGEHMHFQKGSGFEYRHSLRVGDQPFELGLQGPVVRKKKRLGLTLVVRF